MKTDLCFHPRRIGNIEIERNLPKIIDIFHSHGVTLAFVFGSILNSESSSDVDIGIFFKVKRKSFLDLYTDIYLDLCSVFKADNIDLAILNETGPAFRFEVVTRGKVIYYTDPDELAAFLEQTFFDFMDTMIFRKEAHQELLQSVREGLMKERRISVQRVDTFLKNLKEALNDLRRLIATTESAKEFQSDEKKDMRNLCIHHLRIALESILDISRHIIAVKGFGIADLETENIIDILGKNGVIPYEFSLKIRGMAGMRNAIVHVYWNLDYEKIFEMIKDRLSDFEDFARYIVQYIEHKGQP